MDDIGMAHECLHSIKKKTLKELILKLDLKKAYDCINWFFKIDAFTKRLWPYNYQLDYEMCDQCFICSSNKWGDYSFFPKW